MQLPQNFLALPTSLLLLLLANTPPVRSIDDDQSLAQWPYNRPPHAKYWPEDPPHRRRDLEAIQEHIIAEHAPVAVKKMSVDESEKFFPEYWGFEERGDPFGIFGEAPRSNSRIKSLQENFEEVDLQSLTNASRLLSFEPAFALHAREETSLNRRESEEIMAHGESFGHGSAAAGAFALLAKRAFQCPTGTSSCTTIAPNLCCATGQTCFSIPDTGLGTVGCCPSGSSCAGSISCAAGNTPCASKIGGGCCIPGYVCAGVGCVPEVITVISSVTLSISSSSAIVVVTTSTTPSVLTITSSSTSTITDTALQTTLSCGCGYQACPLNLGGGCCPTDRLCGLGGVCPLPSGINTISVRSSGSCITTSTATASAPIRPTSASDSPAPATTTTPTPTVTGGSCPTGFYACSAFYRGGCCRTGRDCATTDCPSTASTTIVSSGVTIVVPLTGAATTTASGSCPTGWSSCAADRGGSCCPSGWDCGLESCASSGASATATSPKQGVVLNEASEHCYEPFWLWEVIVIIVSCLSLVV